MRLPPRRYQAMGAAIVAGAVTARYVAKWRRRRLRRLGDQREGNPSGNRVFVGIDFHESALEIPTTCSVATLDTELNCHFGTWQYREDGLGILPNAALGKPFSLAIAGPQGLAATENSTSRDSERSTNTFRKTPHRLISDGSLSFQTTKESINLFYSLVSSGARFRLLGLNDTSAMDANLIEVSPDSAWRSLSNSPLPAKASTEGRRQRSELLQVLGVNFISGPQVTDSQLDSAISAWVAFCLENGKVHLVGTSPYADTEWEVFREGFLVQPDVDFPNSSLDSDSFAPV